METSRKLVQALSLLSLVVVPVAQAADRAGPALDRVEVQAAPVLRHDVSRSCPTVQADLQAALGRVITRYQMEGSYPVLFELKDNDVVSVRAGRVPREYSLPLRRAIRDLDCQDHASTQKPQRFGFMLDIVMDDGDRPTRVAGVTLRPLVGSDLR